MNNVQCIIYNLLFTNVILACPESIRLAQDKSDSGRGRLGDLARMTVYSYE